MTIKQRGRVGADHPPHGLGSNPTKRLGPGKLVAWPVLAEADAVRHRGGRSPSRRGFVDLLQLSRWAWAARALWFCIGRGSLPKVVFVTG